MHRRNEGYAALSNGSRFSRDQALQILTDRLGALDARDIRTLHCQAMFDSLANKPPTANRLFDEVSTVFAWGLPRGFGAANPAAGVERIGQREAYAPGPITDLQTLLGEAQEHIARVALVALDTGRDRADVLERFTEANANDDVWTLRRGKTKRQTQDVIWITLHPMIQAVINTAQAERRARGIVEQN
ncbi:MAG: hypothetical protein AAGC57_15045 [Pseudomonadota bacterium]